MVPDTVAELDGLYRRHLAARRRRIRGALLLWASAALFFSPLVFIGRGSVAPATANLAMLIWLASLVAVVLGVWWYVGGRRRSWKVDKAAARIFGSTEVPFIDIRHGEVIGSVCADIHDGDLGLVEHKSIVGSRAIRLGFFVLCSAWLVGGLYLVGLATHKAVTGGNADFITVAKAFVLHVVFPAIVAFSLWHNPVGIDTLICRGAGGSILVSRHRLLARRRVSQLQVSGGVTVTGAEDGAGRGIVKLSVQTPEGATLLAQAPAGLIDQWKMVRLALALERHLKT